MNSTTTTPKPTTGERAVNLAVAAGFEITEQGADRPRNTYLRILDHADGRRLTIDTQPDDTRFVRARGYHCGGFWWNTTRLTVRSVPALARLLAS